MDRDRVTNKKRLTLAEEWMEIQRQDSEISAPIM
jgi:hypothetical protein